jgi:hypothetical protein
MTGTIQACSKHPPAFLSAIASGSHHGGATGASCERAHLAELSPDFVSLLKSELDLFNNRLRLVGS